MLKSLPLGEYQNPWCTNYANPLLLALINVVKAGRCAEMTPIEQIAALAFETDIRHLAGDGPFDALRAEMRRCRGEGLDKYVERLCRKPVAPETATQTAEAVPGWRDEDELTREEAAARLGTTKRYFRTQFEAGRVRGKRYSRKIIRYIWGEVREDWQKLTA